MRRFILALCVLVSVCVVVVIAKQVVTHEEPPPLARVAGMPSGPQATYYCDNGRVMMIYITNSNQRVGPLQTERRC